jgi:glycosyltransferase involved in cell wall biosynthesis
MTADRPQSIRVGFYTDATAWGGAEQVLGHLIAHLGSHVGAVVIGIDGAIVERLASQRPECETALVPKVADKRALGAMLRLRGRLNELGLDVLHVSLQTPAAAQWAILAAHTIPGLRVVAVEQLPLPVPGRLRRRLKHWNSQRLAAHVAVGKSSAREIEELFGLKPGSVRVIHNAVPKFRVPRGARLGAQVIGAAGRFHPQKGFDTLLHALAELPGVRLRLVGDGPERERLIRLSKSLELEDRVEFEEWVEEPAAALGGIDLFCLPSRFEGLPLALLEAMRAGIPVVGTDVGSVSDAIDHGVTGLLVPPDDPSALAAAAAQILRDADLRERFAREAQVVADERFSAEMMTERFEALYAEVTRRS